MDKLPFSVYDFFGYLAAGFALLVGLAASFAASAAWQTTPSTVVSVILIVAAYCAGQVIANVSGWVIETLLVGAMLGGPTRNLLTTVSPPKVRSFVFPGYYRPLPAAQREACFRKSGLDESAGDGLFYRCFSAVKGDQTVSARLSTFLNLYGFCRNMSLALLAVGACLLAGDALGTARTGSLISPAWCAAAALAMSVGLLYRYLKFFRHYSVEVFVSYAEQP